MIANALEESVLSYFVGTNNVRSEGGQRMLLESTRPSSTSLGRSVICRLILRDDVDSLTLRRMTGLNSSVHDLCRKTRVMLINVSDQFLAG